jgi:histone demethylase
MIKFATNCDLSDKQKWDPQIKELMKLPPWARVVSAGTKASA